MERLETSERWTYVLRWLEQAGACNPEGFQIGQRDLAARVGIPVRSLRTVFARMEAVKILHVTRTTIDGTFGQPRAQNIYRLLVTAEQWTERADEYLAQILEDRKAQAAAARRAKAQGRARESLAPRERPVAYRPVDPDMLPVDDEPLSDADLVGW